MFSNKQHCELRLERRNGIERDSKRDNYRFLLFGGSRR